VHNTSGGKIKRASQRIEQKGATSAQPMR
jgi:hypothetical protein